MKIIAALTTLFCFSLTIAAANNFEVVQDSIEGNASIMAESCVSIKSQSGEWGSGVIVSETGLIFSVAHVFEKKGERVTIFFNNGDRVGASVLEMNVSHDLAVLQMDAGVRVVAAQLKREEITKEPTTLVAAGHASGFNSERKAPLRVGFGFSTPKDGMIFTTCRITIGDSGGPLYDESGKLCGVHKSMDSRGKYSCHVPVKYFFELWPSLVGKVFEV